MKESALKSALEDIKKLKTKMRGSGHRNGEIDVYSGNDLSTAVSDTWLVVEVRDVNVWTNFRLTSYFNAERTRDTKKQKDNHKSIG